MKKIYITGTDTEVGKTYFSGLLCRHLVQSGKKVCYIKPVQTGYPADDDAKTVQEMSGADCRVLYTAEPPVAPYIAFEQFPFEETVETINSVSGYDWLIVEGAGGIMVPLDDDYMNYHLAKECGLSCIVVVPSRLGCVNHALLNKHFLEAEGINFEGFAVNNHYVTTKFDNFNISMLNDLTAHSVRYVFSKDFEYIND
ncbi:dethiobiotin synthase [Denitrovibrio acetiphilus DSM 12809]|uniref:ATP-dependent dethiobiotin synthetase BioD n=1 Tax=Denitrovibrio acetiphilus (strain DSM 12809 / NBRC 114555 / N2460) TaxID=522772 RepID=D4H781_DENA2|nr:dethiobiotin synthase [Denitrovibrio acetiphilus]ADD67880.1 dethiobiotin synthase [Denitrovibrio acetiphilus DSM 12809]